jgi:hypothetical protein
MGSPQDSAHGGPPDLQSPGDLGLADALTVELPYLTGFEGCGLRPPQTLSIQPGMRQSSSHPLPENLAFELREYSE